MPASVHRGRSSDPPALELFAQLALAMKQARTHGRLGHADNLGSLARGALLHFAQHEGNALLHGQRIERAVERAGQARSLRVVLRGARLGLGLTRLSDRAPSGALGSFGSGVLATVVATPCTAPFMGVALGYALTVSAPVALLVFTFLGLGMAAPYVVLSSFPRWLDRLPRPGPWMVGLKQFLAFPLLATVLYLAWILGQQEGLDVMAKLLAGLLLLGFAAWCYGRWGGAGTGPRRRWVLGRALPVGIAALGLLLPFARPAEAAWTWEPFSAARVETLRGEGRAVFVDFTADW